MKRDLMDKFVSALRTKTLAGEIEWERLTKMQQIKYDDIEGASNDLYFLLFTNEWREIFFWDSYYATTPQGDIFLLYEQNESGRDGSISEGFSLNVYRDKSGDNKVIRLDMEQSDLYALSDVIKHYLDSVEIEQEDFITSFIAG